jgi:hypothetical protein
VQGEADAKLKSQWEYMNPGKPMPAAPQEGPGWTGALAQRWAGGIRDTFMPEQRPDPVPAKGFTTPSLSLDQQQKDQYAKDNPGSVPVKPMGGVSVLGARPEAEQAPAAPAAQVTPMTPVALATPVTLATPVALATPAPSPMELKMMELMDQFSRLALRLEANLAGRPASAANVPRGFPGAMPRPFGERFSNCIWCDATDHMRQLCPAFMDVLREGKVRYNENRRLVNIATGEELPLNFGRGGQQAIFKQQLASTAAAQLSGSSNVNAITAEPQYATLGSENSVVLTTLYDDGTARHDIIDVEVDEKRKRDDIVGQSGR